MRNLYRYGNNHPPEKNDKRGEKRAEIVYPRICLVGRMEREHDCATLIIIRNDPSKRCS